MQTSRSEKVELITLLDKELTGETLKGLKRLFEDEYAALYGSWTQSQPYGYSPAELHVIAVLNGEVIGNVGMQRRQIAVGNQQILIAGTGGVLIKPSCRQSGVGQKLLSRLQEANRTLAPVDFGYLGCREEVVPFYESCNYTRITATERYVSDDDQTTLIEHTGSPIMICSGMKGVDDWPVGLIDLCGTPW